MLAASQKAHMSDPILYSFRRCPYAMRARLALVSSYTRCQLREVVLRDKPAAFLEASPKGTVPVLIAGGQVIEESFEIMQWALNRADPEGWLDNAEASEALIAQFDTRFKTALDRYKYHTRYADADAQAERNAASKLLRQLEPDLSKTPWLFGDHPRLADVAILPFVRQFANTDRAWFDAQNWTGVRGWLSRFETSDRFAAIMSKYPKWAPEEPKVYFP